MPATLTTEAVHCKANPVLTCKTWDPCHACKTTFGKSKGKIEKFHQVVDDFIRESKLKNIRTLEELNRLWAVYLEEYYHKQKHAVSQNTTKALEPLFGRKDLPLQSGTGQPSADLSGCDGGMEAFLHHEQRKVDGSLHQLPWKTV